MNSRAAYTAIVALMACSMLWAQSTQSQGAKDSQTTPTATQEAQPQSASPTDSPVTKEGESKSSVAHPKNEMPGAMGAPTSPSATAGETPATGSPAEKKGADAGNSARTEANPQSANPSNSATAPTSSDQNQKNIPSYEKPIDEDNSTSTTPSQQGTDTGTESPK